MAAAPPPGLIDRAFADGRLVRPSVERAGLVHLARALMALAGDDAADRSGPSGELVELIGPAEHLVFVLADGLGLDLVRSMLPPDAFLRRTLRAELLAPCPSTTAAALTCVATGAWPADHGVTGWFTHLPDHGLTATLLPFVERFGGRPLGERGLSVADVVPARAMLGRLRTHAPLSLTPSYIADTAYNRFSRGGTEGGGYTTLADGIARAIDRVGSATRPTYTHLYVPDVDTACHHVGVGHRDVAALLLHLDGELARLAEAVGARGGRVVVSADHGLIDVAREDQTFLRDGDPLLATLACPPTGDARMPIFHCRPGMTGAFAAVFDERFGGRFALVPTGEAERLRLFGPGPIAAGVRPRFGDFVAFPMVAATLAYAPGDGAAAPKTFVGVHGGMSPQEMWVPLCVA